MYTSRLPVSTSARRPNGHAEGTSTSFIGLNRASNIPVTVRKANLFTPQTKRPFSTGASTAGKSYTLTTDKKYQRPLKPVPDREEQMRMFNNLTEYLKVNAPHLPLPDAKKFFSSVSTTESSRIFEFLISRILPEFKISRLEVDVPEALGMLEYPYIRTVTKSALVSVTTRQAVVGLLFIFDWLVSNVTEYESNEFDELELKEGDPADQKELAFQIVTTQPETKHDDTTREVFDRLFPPIQIDNYREEGEKVETEIEKLHQDLQQIYELESERQLLDEDIEKCQAYNAQMQKYLGLKKEELDNQLEESMRLDLQYDEKFKKIEQLRLSIKNHELKIDEVKRDKCEIDMLEKDLAQILEEKNAFLEDRSQADKKDDKVLEKFKSVRNEDPIREMVQIYESHDVESDLWSQRKKELHEFARKLEQVPLDDLEQNRKLEQEQSLFLEKLRATNHILEAELKNSMDKLKYDLDALESINVKYETETIPNLKKALERVIRETSDDNRQHLDNISKLDSQLDEEKHRFIRVKDNLETKVATLEKELEVELQLSNEVMVESVEISELNEKHLKSVLETNRQKASCLVQDLKRKRKKWEKAKILSEENFKVGKTLLKVLK